MQKPQLGDPYRFVPAAFSEGPKVSEKVGQRDIPVAVTGRIVYINWAHRFFNVEFAVDGVKMAESFKF